MVIKDGLKRLYVGKLVRDPEFSTFGSKGYPKMRTAIAYGDEGIINVDALFQAVDAWHGLKKGDFVIVSGTLKCQAVRHDHSSSLMGHIRQRKRYALQE